MEGGGEAKDKREAQLGCVDAALCSSVCSLLWSDSSWLSCRRQVMSQAGPGLFMEPLLQPVPCAWQQPSLSRPGTHSARWQLQDRGIEGWIKERERHIDRWREMDAEWDASTCRWRLQLNDHMMQTMSLKTSRAGGTSSPAEMSARWGQAELEEDNSFNHCYQKALGFGYAQGFVCKWIMDVLCVRHGVAVVLRIHLFF